MKNNSKIFLIASLLLGFLATSAAVLFKHYYKMPEYHEILSTLGIVLFYIFAGLAIYEVQQSTRIGTGERRMWTVFLIVMPNITGLIYLISGRDKVIPREKRI